MRTHRQLRTLGTLLFLAASFAATTPANSQGRYLETSDYLRTAFPAGEPDSNTIWVTKEIRESAEEALGYVLSSLRIRYWQQEQRTAWIFDEIGKERPITIGVVVEDDAASLVRVLEFRESRGWEVRYPFFTDQFNDVKLDEREEVDRRIDSISGATMSVDAVTRVVRLALFLYRYTGEING